MIKYYKLVVATLITTMFCHSVSGQLGKQLGVNLVIPQISSPKLDFTGNAGFGINYSLFAKYSERMEWTTLFTFAQASLTNKQLTAISNSFGGNSYTITETENKLNVLNFGIGYELTYYVIPDALGISAGFALGVNYGEILAATSSDGSGSTDNFLTENPENYIGKTYPSFSSLESALDKQKSVFDVAYTSSFLYYGPQIGLSYTLAERYVFKASYLYQLNSFFDTDEAQNLITYLETSNLRLFNFGVAIKLLPSVAAKRF
jgi:hypothetical protein